jgi:hypothetical protein
MTDAPSETLDPRRVRRDTIIRLATGLVQGLLLYVLHQASEHKAWPATQPPLFAALALVVLFVPFVVLAGVSSLRWRTLAGWKLGAVLVAAGLAAYEIWTAPYERYAGDGVRNLPDGSVFCAIAALLFIGHHLIQPADAERRWIARFENYFDVTWKHGVQLVLSLLFTGAFWLLLFLAAALFKLIGVEAIDKLIKNEAFSYPATTVMFAAAVQLTDVRANLVRGVRSVALTLLAWLLPLMVLIAAGFLASLPFTGLAPLWGTKKAAALLLTAAAFLIVLTNAAYQDGTEKTPVVLRWTARLAGLLLVPITILAAYGLALRIGQYGLSPDRIIAAASVLIAAGYALGYAIAAVRPGAWMKGLEPTNIAMAFVTIAVLLALFTPIADPKRLSVGDQVKRLERGKVAPDKFDFEFLRFDSARFGRDALDHLKTNANPEIARRAKAAAALTDRTHERTSEPTRPGHDPRITFYPKGARPPEGFLTTSPPEVQYGGCFSSDAECDARTLDITGDGRPEVLTTSGWMIEVYGPGDDGVWRKLGGFQPPCSGFDSRKAVREGSLGVAEPAIKDLTSPAGPMRFSPEDRTTCPQVVKPVQSP